MNFEKKYPPRIFKVGLDETIKISDCGSIHLEQNEQITFVTSSGKEHDFAAKSWGFYVTPSINGRLKKQGFKTALVKNSSNKYYVMTVEVEQIDKFQAYIEIENQTVVEWLDERCY